MHGLHKHSFFKKINALALVLSVLVHFGLAFLIYFSGTVESKHSELLSAGFLISLIPVDSSMKNLPPLDLESVNNSSSLIKMVEPLSDAAVLSPAGKYKFDSLLPLISPVKSHYFSAKELTRKPLIARDIPSDTLLVAPDVPEQAATLRIQVNEYGDVDKVIVETSLLPQAAQKRVVEEFEKVKFHPGEINGVAVKSELIIEIMLEKS